jgi:tryptophan-rich sensory protein
MKSFIAFLLAVAGVAFTASRFRPGEWYMALQKPAWTPPNWLFAPVWTLLYVAIAVAGWLVWRRLEGQPSAPLIFWVAQLVLNGLWSWLFFGLHRPGLALIDIVLLEAAIIGFAISALPTARLAAGLFVPYAVWVGYATALNLFIWQANRPAVALYKSP